MVHRYVRVGEAWCYKCHETRHECLAYEQVHARGTRWQCFYCLPCAEQAHPVLWKKFVVEDIKQRMIS